MANVAFQIPDSKLKTVISFLKKEGAVIISCPISGKIAEEKDDELAEMALAGMKSPKVNLEAFKRKLKKGVSSRKKPIH